MLVGVAITNLGDAIGAKLDFTPIERGGEIALQAFLVMYALKGRDLNIPSMAPKQPLVDG